jgi:hypothetical protein
VIGRAVTAEYVYNRRLDVALFLIYTGTYEELEYDYDYEIGDPKAPSSRLSWAQWNISGLQSQVHILKYTSLNELV